jgi:hypothetical protein
MCSFAMIIALWIIGVASAEELRQIIQTLPLWIGVVLGFRNSEWSKSAALPFFIFWLAIMTLIWLYLFGWSRMITGRYSHTEIAMTCVIGMAGFLGIVECVRMKTRIKIVQAAPVFVLTALAQYMAMYISLLSRFRNR